MTCRALSSRVLQINLAIVLVNGCLKVTAQSPAALAAPPPTLPAPATPVPRPVLDPAMEQVFRTQLALARLGFSPGSIDGVMGPKTSSALRAFQASRNLAATGQPDAATGELLRLAADPFRNYTVTAEDLARLRPLGETWLSKSEQDRLDYETILELAAEKSQASPRFLQRLNPSVDWTNLTPGTTLVVPNAEPPTFDTKAAFLRINLAECFLQAWRDETNLMVQFPCSIGREFHQRPVGQLQVAVIIPDPNYTFNPRVFPESEEARRLGRKLILPPGPNNPVGTAWIGLNLPGYGIHGTPKPEQVGSAESHGCFRLANWNAELLLQLVWVSMPVEVFDGESAPPVIHTP